MRLAAVEAAVVGVAGCVLGLAGAMIVGRLAFGSASFGGTTATAAGVDGRRGRRGPGHRRAHGARARAPRRAYRDRRRRTA